MVEVSKKNGNSIFLKSVLKLYFKHFYFKLFNSCLYGGKKKNLCLGILKCVRALYGVIGLNLVVWSFLTSAASEASSYLVSLLEDSHQTSISFTSKFCNCAT